LGAVAWVALGGVARADRKGDAGAAARAEELVQRGLQERRAGDDQGALPLFKEAYDLSGSARAVTQLGFCHQALGQWLEAETNITEGLKAADDPWIRKNRETITEALRTVKMHIGRLEVAGEPDGAEVAVNGAPVGKLPIPSLVRVEAGDVSIELHAPGYLPASKTVRIGGAQHQKVTIRLERAPALATAGAGGTVPSAAGGGAALSDPRPPAQAVAVKVAADGGQAARLQGADTAGSGGRGDTSDGAGPSTARKSAKWVAWGLSAVGAGLGVYGTVRNGSLVHDFNSGCGFDPDTGHAIPSPGSSRSMSQCADLASRYETASHLGIGGFVGAGVFAAAGLILWLTEPAAAVEQKRDVARSLTCVPQLTSRLAAGIGCGFAFF